MQTFMPSLTLLSMQLLRNCVATPGSNAPAAKFRNDMQVTSSGTSLRSRCLCVELYKCMKVVTGPASAKIAQITLALLMQWFLRMQIES